MMKDNQQDLHDVIALFRKSFSSTLSPEEQFRLNEMLADDSIRRVYNQLCNKKYITKKIHELESYPYAPAYEKFRKMHTRRVTLRRRLYWGSVAIVVFAVILGVRFLFSDNVQESIPVIEPGRSLAILTLADGRTVSLDERPVTIMQPGSNKIISENRELIYNDNHTDDASMEYNQISTPMGGEYKVRLDDRTVVYLNADSRLIYPVAFGGSERCVSLEGEAYFEVTRDDRPFIVETKSGKIEVLGTSFVISAYPDEEELTTLVEGSVSFTLPSGQQVLLTPGEQARVSTGGHLTTHWVNVDEFVGWKNGEFVFRNKSLGDMMKILSRWYGVRVEFADPFLAQVEYSGNLKRYESINLFLELLERLNDTHYKIYGKTITLYR